MPIKDVVKTGIKTAFSFLLTILVFAGLIVASSLGVFSKIENSLYEPARINVIRKKLDSVSNCSNAYISNILTLLSPESEKGYLSNEALVSLLQKEPSEEALRAYETLCSGTEAIQGIRLVDQNGKRLHYSTFKNDSRKEGSNRIYSNYPALKTISNNNELDYSLVSAFVTTEEEKEKGYKIVYDGSEQRIIISYPFYYQNAGYSFIFYLDIYELVNELVQEHFVSLGEKITLVSSADGKKGGLVFGMPKSGQKILAEQIVKHWEKAAFTPEEIVVSENAVPLSGITAGKDSSLENTEKSVVSWNVLTSEQKEFLYVSGLYSLDMLVMPVYVRILLFIAAFITVNLILLLIFSVRKDDDVVISNRIKKIQLSLLNDYFEKDYSKKKVASLIELQKDDLSQKVKKSLGSRGKKYRKQLDFMLNQSWLDIINVLKGSETSEASGLSKDDMAEIRQMFEEIVSSGKLKVQAVNAVAAPVQKQEKKTPVPKTAVPKAEEVEELEDVEAVDELEEVDSVDELEEVEPVGDLDEVEAVDELEDVEPVEELEDLEEAEAVDDLEDVEEVEAVEELGEVEEVEPVEDLEEVSEVEALEEVDAADDAEDLEEVESLDDAEAVEEIEEVEDLEVAENIDDAEDIEEVEPVEELEDVKEAEDAAALENGEEVEDAEPAEGLEEIEEAEDKNIDKAIDEAALKEEVLTYRDVRRFEGTEPLVIGINAEIHLPTDIQDCDDSVADDFFISAPGDFMFTEEYKSEETQNIETGDAEEAEKESLDDVSDLEPVQEDGFMFTTFAANDNNVTELCPEAIVLGDDGVFHITDNLATSNVHIDEEFKKLVDSVLK